MNNKFKDAYKVQKTPIEISDEVQLGLIKNEEYDNMTDELCISIYNYFIENYPEVSIEIPKKRIKSPKSTHEKSKSREIERLSKLYTIQGTLQQQELQELYSLLEERIREKEQNNINVVLEKVKDLLEKNIEYIDIQDFLDTIMVDEISSSTKKALLRILNSKIERSTLTDKNKKLEMLDNKYGKKAAQISGIPEDNVMQYESIEEIRKDKSRIQLLKKRVEYLKSEDLIATKIVITSIPDTLNTKNEKIKELLTLRNRVEKNSEKIKYEDMAMKMLSEEFINKISEDKEFLKGQGIEVIPFSIKHKNKTSGYEAYHIKFRFIDKPEYTMELQVKTGYVENISRGFGEASHEKRPGKQRNLPSVENKEEFKRIIEYTIPKYTLFAKKNGKFEKIRKCTTRENLIGYYENEFSADMYEQMCNALEENSI